MPKVARFMDADDHAHAQVMQSLHRFCSFPGILDNGIYTAASAQSLFPNDTHTHTQCSKVHKKAFPAAKQEERGGWTQKRKKRK